MSGRRWGRYTVDPTSNYIEIFGNILKNNLGPKDEARIGIDLEVLRDGKIRKKKKLAINYDGLVDLIDSQEFDE